MVTPNQALPESGRVLPVITSIIVVLPAPFGPMMQRSSPTSMYSVQIVQRAEAVEADRDVFEIQNRAVRGIGHRPLRQRRPNFCQPCSDEAFMGVLAVSGAHGIAGSFPEPRPAIPTTPRGSNSVTTHEQRAEHVQPDFRQQQP